MTSNKTFIYLLLWFIFITVCAYIMPYTANDSRYMMIEGTNDLVTNFGDILLSQYRHYFDWGGRTPPHVLAQSLLLSGKYFAALCQGVCYITLIYLIYIMALGKKIRVTDMNLKAVAFITIGLWLCLRAYGEVIFMLVTSCNYFYTTTFILAFLLPYRFSLSSVENTVNSKEHGVVFALLMFILGIISGWCNENTGFAICATTFLLLCYLFFIKKQKLTLWQITGFVGMCIGFLVLVLSPGNGARLHQMESTGNFDYFAHIFHALGIYGLTLLECLPILIALIYQLYLCYSHKLFKKHQDFFVGFLYVFLVGFLALTIMVFSPNFPARSSAPFTIFVISANVALYLLLKQENVKVMPKTLMYSMYAVFGIYFLVTSSNCIYGLNTLNQDMAKRTELVQEKIAKGEKNLLVEPLTVETSRYIFVADVRVKKDFYANLIMSRYYHIDSIQRSCDYVKTFTHSDLIIIQDFGTPVCQATKQN